MSSESSFAGRINGVVADGELGNDMRSLTLPSTKTDTGIPKDAVLIGAMGYSPPNTGSAGAVYLVLDASETLKSYNTNVSDMEHVLLGGAGSGENAGWNVRIDGIDDGGLPFLFVAARDKVDDEGTIVGGVYMASISNLIAE